MKYIAVMERTKESMAEGERGRVCRCSCHTSSLFTGSLCKVSTKKVVVLKTYLRIDEVNEREREGCVVVWEKGRGSCRPSSIAVHYTKCLNEEGHLSEDTPE